jgi:signal transduction histidine kinase
MSSLRTRLYLLQRQPDQAEIHLAVLNQVTDQLVNLVDFMLDLSRFQNGVVTLEFKRVNLKPFAAGLIAVHQPIAEQQGLTLLTELPGQPIYIYADSARLNQVVGNLLSNAISYTPSSGRVTLRVGLAGEQALIQVQDSGVGIAAEHIPHLFKPFYRAGKRMDSTGLGLAIVKEIVDLHGGSISVESQVGKGTTFTVLLPLYTEAPTPDLVPDSSPAAR